MGAFNRAWTLLKNRGFEVDPRYEDERERRLQEMVDTDEAEMVAMHGGNPYSTLAEQRRLPSQLGPMYQHQQDQEAERIEAEGIQLPDTPSTVTFEDDYPDRSTAPPADIGRAGSSIPPGRGLEPRYLFNPFKYGSNNPSTLTSFTAQFDPVGKQPPQPLQFEKAWQLLKANPYMMSYGKTVHPSVANYMMMGNQIIDETENPREDGSVMSREELQEMARHLVSERMKSTALDNPTPFGPYGKKSRFMFPEEERMANLRNYDMYHYDPELYEGQLEQR